MPVQTVVLSLLPPLGIALVILLAAWRPWSKAPPPAMWGTAGSALALALGFAVTESLVLHSWPGFPAREAHRWLPYAGLAAAIGAIVLKGREDGRFGAGSVIALVSFAALRWGELSSKSSMVYGALWVVMATMIAGSMRVDAATAGKSGVRVPLSWWAASVGLSLVGFHESFQSAFLSGSLAVVMGVFVVVALWRPKL